MKVVSIVGMTGAGKSEVSKVFEMEGYTVVRFGDLTDEEMKRRRVKPGESSERAVRETLRREHGAAAYAELNQPRIEHALKGSDVVIDGLYSWEEYNCLKSCYTDSFYLVAVWSSPKTRYARLASRSSRRLTLEEAAGRDIAEIENIAKGGPIAMADFTIINESSLEELKKETEKVISALKWKK